MRYEGFLDTTGIHPLADEPLTNEEQVELSRHETTIQAGMESFVAVGQALIAINESRLYRATHRTFDAYITERWPQIGSMTHAYRFMRATSVVSDIEAWAWKENRQISPPASESQARPLTRIAPAQRGPVYAEAVATAPQGRVTAAHITQTVARYVPTDEVVPPPSPPAPLIDEFEGVDGLMTFFDELDRFFGDVGAHIQTARIREDLDGWRRKIAMNKQKIARIHDLWTNTMQEHHDPRPI